MYKKCKIKLSNNFHNSEIMVTAFFKAGNDQILITRGQANRARRKLCGIKGCTCGDIAGCRPQQVTDFPGKFLEISGEIEKILDGYYGWDFPSTKEGKLIKLEGTRNL